MLGLGDPSGPALIREHRPPSPGACSPPPQVAQARAWQAGLLNTGTCNPRTESSGARLCSSVQEFRINTREQDGMSVSTAVGIGVPVSGGGPGSFWAWSGLCTCEGGCECGWVGRYVGDGGVGICAPAGGHLRMCVSMSTPGWVCMHPYMCALRKGGLGMLPLPSVAASESLSVSGVARERPALGVLRGRCISKPLPSN